MRRFHFKHFSMYHDRSTMKVGTDAVMLGAWAEVRPDDWVLDIGTGCGIIALMLAQKGAWRIHGVDLDEASVYEAANNFEASQWRDRIFAFHADIRRFQLGCKYDLVISNPPFFLHSYKCDEDRRNQARHTDTSLTFSDLVISAKRLMKPEGRLALVLPERESHDFLSIAGVHNLFPYKIQEIIPVRGKEPNRLNMELRFGAPQEVITTSLTMRDEENQFTQEYHDLLKDFYLG